MVGGGRLIDQQSLRCARILCDIHRLQQPRDDNNAAGTCGDYLGKILEFDSPDAEDRQPRRCVNRPNFLQPDWHVLWFCRCRKKWPPANVIGTFDRRAFGLRKAVSGSAHKALPARDLSHRLDASVVLPDVNAFYRHLMRNFCVIVDDERDARRGGDGMHFGCDAGDRAQIERLCSQLNNVDSACDHFAGDTGRIPRHDVSEINNAVKPAAAEIDGTQRVTRLTRAAAWASA